VSEKELVYPARLPGRTRVGMGERSCWFQFGRYAIVRASGYMVSIATFPNHIAPRIWSFRV
jgi:hypothetical protein